jgi:hypothetical protein
MLSASTRWLERILLALPSARSVPEPSCHPPAAQVASVLPTATVEVECSQADVEYELGDRPEMRRSCWVSVPP